VLSYVKLKCWTGVRPWLTVLKTNAAAIALYQSQGYATDDSGGFVRRLADLVWDPVGILQHRMSKPLLPLP